MGSRRQIEFSSAEVILPALERDGATTFHGIQPSHRDGGCRRCYFSSVTSYGSDVVVYSTASEILGCKCGVVV